MAGKITHAHVSAIADDGSDVGRNAWNADHILSLTATDVGVRVPLTADTTKNVPADFANLPLALAYAATVDFNGFTLKIKLANGTYTASPTFNIPVCVGQTAASKLIIEGDTTTPGNVILTSTVAFAGIIECPANAFARIQGVKFVGGGSTFGMHAIGGGQLEYTACEISTGFYAGFSSEAAGNITCVGSLTVSAGTTVVILTASGGTHFQVGSAITVTGIPSWVAGYAFADAISFVRVAGAVFTGAATGPRYGILRNSVIDVSGAGATYFPGDAGPITDGSGFYS